MPTLAACCSPSSTPHPLATALARRRRSLTVRHLRQVLLWPLRLMPVRAAAAQCTAGRGSCCATWATASPWREVVDEYTGDATLPRAPLQRVRHLPALRAAVPVRRGPSRRDAGGRDAGSPMRVFRRHDVAAVRVVAAARRRAGDARGRARRPVLLLRRRRGAAQRRGRRRRPAAGAGAGDAVPLRPRLPGGLGRRRPGAALHGRASNGWARTARAGALRRAAARGVPGPRRRTPRAAHRRALGVHARAAGARPLRRTTARCATARSSTTACR